MVERDFTGFIYLPDGSGVVEGIFRVIPVRPSPSDSTGVVLPKYMDFEIEDGVVEGTLMAPARYNFQVFVEEEMVWNWFGGVTETTPIAPLTIQDIYASSIDPDDVVVLSAEETYVYNYSKLGAVSDGVLDYYLVPDGVDFTSAGALLSTGPTEDGMTVTISDGTDDVVFSWDADETVPTISGLPVSFSADADLSVVASDSAGSSDLRMYFRGVKS